jgi:hypothetical protein
MTDSGAHFANYFSYPLSNIILLMLSAQSSSHHRCFVILAVDIIKSYNFENIKYDFNFGYIVRILHGK